MFSNSFNLIYYFLCSPRGLRFMLFDGAAIPYVPLPLAHLPANPSTHSSQLFRDAFMLACVWTQGFGPHCQNHACLVFYKFNEYPSNLFCISVLLQVNCHSYLQTIFLFILREQNVFRQSKILQMEQESMQSERDSAKLFHIKPSFISQNKDFV